MTKTVEVYYQESPTSALTKLTNVISVRVVRTSDIKNNSLEVELSNRNGEAMENGEIKYLTDNYIRVYIADGLVDVNDVSHLFGIFFIKTPTLTSENKRVKLECGNNTYKYLNKVYTADNVGKTSREIIYNVVQVGDSTGLVQNNVTTVMDTTKSNGQPFKIINYAAANKTMYEVVSELSQPEFTGDDKPYLFWVDEFGKFYWTYPTNTLDEYVISYSSTDVLSMKTTKNDAETISSIIYDAGYDLEGVSIVNLYHSPTSTSTNIKYKTMLDINTFVRWSLKNQYGLANVENSTLLSVITNDTFITLVKNFADARAAKYISVYSRGKWQATVEMKGAKYTMSTLHRVVDALNYIASVNLRITRIVDKFDKNGWTTSLELEEDVDKITL